MIAVLSQQRLALVLVASVAGIVAWWPTPFGLLAILGFAFAGSVLAASLDAGGMRDLAWSWAALFAVALCTGAIVATNVSALESWGWRAETLSGRSSR